jgi:hypothetical protein
MPGHERANSEGRMSRRDFARAAALAAATAALPQSASVQASASAQATSAQAPQLSPAGEAQLQTILARYGKRLSDDQKTEVKRLVIQAQKTSETLRSLPLDNSDEPAMTFHIYRSDRR